jgi:chemosensory pili system protein ChpE
METLFFSAFTMSIAFAAQPGVITFEAIRRGVTRGWRSALHLEFGSLVGDATWALVALIGVAFLFQNRTVALAFSVFGCYLLLRLAWGAWKSSQNEVHHDHTPTSDSGDFLAGAALSLSNPNNLTFWLGMSGTVISLGFLNPQPSHLLVFFVGFMLAQVCWCFFFAGLVSVGRKYLNQRLFRLVNMACAGFLAYIGFNLVVGTIQLLVAQV